jgi:hypothetical protein
MTKLDTHYAELADIRIEGSDSITVPEMLGILERIRKALVSDVCLSDLSEPVRSIITELEERRRIALAVADQIDAEKCTLKN